MAAYATVVPLATLRVLGVTASEVSVAVVTLSVAVPVTPLAVAEIVVCPCPAPEARPRVAAALEMVATDVADDAQVACAVRFCVELSENVPVAVNCCVVPLAMDGAAGVTSMRTSVALVTERSVVPETPPTVAVTIVEPVPAPVAMPREPAALEIVTTARLAEDQPAAEVTSCVEPSE